MKAKKFRGFTLIELIVVVAIIGVLAAILVPSMIGYVRMSRIRNYNSNAATVYRGGQLACVDMAREGKTIPPNTIFVNNSDGDYECKDSNGNIIDISDYVGEEFHGYFGFVTDSGGAGCLYAIWSEKQLNQNDIKDQLSEEDVKNIFTNGGTTPRGCHPLKSPDISDNGN